MMRPLLLTMLLAAAMPAWADAGHDHGGPAPMVNANGPSRQPDGSVFLPKPAQRQLGLRTLVVQPAELPRTIELAGRVVMDPNAGGKVQPMAAGRIEAGPKGLPVMGQRVRKGEVLAYVTAATAAIERSSQAAQIAELRAARTLADKRLLRLRDLSDTVPRKEIEAVESEASSLAARIAALSAAVGAREALVAPVSGVIAAAYAVAGQVVDARELVYEVVDPAQLDVEALAFDTALASDVASASMVVGDTRVELRFVGAARSLREQALPMVFRAQGDALATLALGQPVKVFVQSRSTVRGVAVPAAALLRNPANQDIVWVKTAPERLEPRVVTTAPLDGARVAVTSGLEAGDRVATQGATLVNQIR